MYMGDIGTKEGRVLLRDETGIFATSWAVDNDDFFNLPKCTFYLHQFRDKGLGFRV